MLTWSRYTLVHVERAVVSCNSNKCVQTTFLRKRCQTGWSVLACLWIQVDSDRWIQLLLHRKNWPRWVQGVSRNSPHLSAGSIRRHFHRGTAHTHLRPPGSSRPCNLKTRTFIDTTTLTSCVKGVIIFACHGMYSWKKRTVSHNHPIYWLLLELYGIVCVSVCELAASKGTMMCCPDETHSCKVK